MSSSTADAATTDPILNIEANGSDGTLDITEGSQLSITISLDPGSYSDTSADWYVVVNTPSGWQSFNASQMDFSTSGLSVLLEDYGLIGFGPAGIFSTSSLSAGTYTYYFAVDLSGQFYYDSVTVSVGGSEYYEFERMWPTLPQPWYFSPSGIAVDKDSNIYIADTTKDVIHKFSTDGNFITKWGSEGSGDGQFNSPKGSAVDSDGNVYVADTYNERIQKFDSDGNFMTKWELVNGDAYSQPFNIAVDSNGNVYVDDSWNNRIEKFDSEGNFLTMWGGEGAGDGQFHNTTVLAGIAVDSDGNVYVADTGNDRIQKFDSDGNFVTKWGSEGSGDGQFEGQGGIAVDSDGNVYVAGVNNHRIQKFDSDGNFITKWGFYGHGNGQFYFSTGIAVDSDGNVYVGDDSDNRIQKFDSDGNFITKWGSSGSDDGMFNYPVAIAVDSDENVYVAEMYNNRVQKFDSDGSFKWVSYGNGADPFFYPQGIGVDNAGNVYVYDRTSSGIVGSPDIYRTSKLDSDGNFITEWETGSGDEGVYFPGEIAVDSNGNAYFFVIDWSGFIRMNPRVQKYDSDGNFVTEWGSEGSGDGQFGLSGEIAVDSNGNVYVADTENDRIQKFDSDGLFIAKVGTLGSSPGQFDSPSDLDIGPNGNLYIADTGNNRIQILKSVTKLSNSKAIIVAGGGPFSGNNLWDTTQMLANYAYNTLTYQGYTKDTIYYVSSDTDLDLDGNGILDDVDADATSANLEYAITNWAADADDVVVYLIDHGGTGTYRMSGTETLTVTELNLWLDALQDAISGKVIIVYDACESGSFMDGLTPPTGKNRIVVTSTSPDEAAYFISSGTISFSNYFWTEIFSGNSLYDSFMTTTNGMEAFSSQTPLIDANGNGIGNEEEDMTIAQSIYIGNSTVYAGSAPVIGSISAEQTVSNTTSADLYAEGVTDDDGVSRVWAVILPPDYLQGPSDQAVQSLPSIDLKSVGSDRYEVAYDDFTIDGTYQVAIYAMDGLTNTSAPEYTTVSVNSPMGRKAIIVAGGPQTDPIWTAVEENARLAYESLTFQGYKDDDIYYMSDAGTTGVDGSLTLGNVDYAINTWAANNTQDLIIYLIGNGDNGMFMINETETLQATDLDIWLDDLQSVISGDVVVIYDGSLSGSIIPLLTPPEDKERIVVCSTTDDESAYFLSDGEISFSRFFWQQISNGDSVYDSYVHAKNSITGQNPQIDDNGNGLSNEKEDGRFSDDYYLGVGIMLGADSPMIGSVSPDQTLDVGTSATIWAEDVTTTGTIDRVWAIVMSPNYEPEDTSEPVLDMPTIDLADVGDARYEGFYSDFNDAGVYELTIYAMDTEGNISLPETTYVTSSDAQTCDYSLSSTSQSFGSSGGTGEVSVIATEGCSWTAVSNDTWITIDSGSSGNGDGTVTHTVSSNSSDSERTGTMQIAGETCTVIQSASTTTSDITDPTPIIMANDSEETLDIKEGNQLIIAISLDTGSYTGTSADWYIVVNTLSGWQSFDISQMDYSTSGLSVLLEDYGLIGFGPAEIFSTLSLSTGTYTYYFAVDVSGQLYYDSVVVNVQ